MSLRIKASISPFEFLPAYRTSDDKTLNPFNLCGNTDAVTDTNTTTNITESTSGSDISGTLGSNSQESIFDTNLNTDSSSDTDVIINSGSDIFDDSESNDSAYVDSDLTTDTNADSDVESESNTQADTETGTTTTVPVGDFISVFANGAYEVQFIKAEMSTSFETSVYNDLRNLFKVSHLIRLDELIFEKCRIWHKMPSSTFF